MVALKAGIIQAEELSKPTSVMTGQEFRRELFGSDRGVPAESDLTMEFMQDFFAKGKDNSNRTKFKQIIHDLRVMARSTA